MGAEKLNPTPVSEVAARSNTASTWARFGAYAIDALLAMTIAVISGWVLFVNNFEVFQPGYIGPLPLAFFINGFTIFIAYQFAFLKAFGATPGKMIFGLKVVSAKSDQPLSWAQAAARAVFSTGFQLLSNMSHIAILFNPQRRQATDYICGTRVISTRRTRTVKATKGRAIAFLIFTLLFCFFNTGENLAAIHYNQTGIYIVTGFK